MQKSQKMHFLTFPTRRSSETDRKLFTTCYHGSASRHLSLYFSHICQQNGQSPMAMEWQMPLSQPFPATWWWTPRRSTAIREPSMVYTGFPIYQSRSPALSAAPIAWSCWPHSIRLEEKNKNKEKKSWNIITTPKVGRNIKVESRKERSKWTPVWRIRPKHICTNNLTHFLKYALGVCAPCTPHSLTVKWSDSTAMVTSLGGPLAA